MKLSRVDYKSLDEAKAHFITASKKTLHFAKEYGYVFDESLGASANLFELYLRPFRKDQRDRLFLTLVPEGLGTADDARPGNITSRELTEFWRNIGIKSVAAMTNDVVSSGLQTILVSLYLPSAQPAKVFSREFLKGFLDGFIAGCKTVGCIYLSGETPQLTTKIVANKIDIAGAAVGILPAGMDLISSRNLKHGDTIVFIESSGPHENGFTTLRDLSNTLPRGYRTKLPNGMEYWKAINTPSKLYTPFIQSVMRTGMKITNVEPITGHGWLKLMRPKQNFRYVVEQMFPMLPIFEFVQKHSGMSDEALFSTFNCGTGLAIFVQREIDAKHVVQIAADHDLRAIVGGHVEQSKQREIYIQKRKLRLSGKVFALKK